MRAEDISLIETATGVNVEVSDESGGTHVYCYTEDGQRLGFRFHSMDPDPSDVRRAADALAELRYLANQLPRIGALEMG